MKAKNPQDSQQRENMILRGSQSAIRLEIITVSKNWSREERVIYLKCQSGGWQYLHSWAAVLSWSSDFKSRIKAVLIDWRFHYSWMEFRFEYVLWKPGRYESFWHISAPTKALALKTAQPRDWPCTLISVRKKKRTGYCERGQQNNKIIAENYIGYLEVQAFEGRKQMSSSPDGFTGNVILKGSWSERRTSKYDWNQKAFI